jgi:hypothetical protein
MMMDATEQQYLRAVFCLSRAGSEISAETIAAAAGLDTTQSTVAMILLGCRGFLDTDRKRLTMKGLAAAARLIGDEGIDRRALIRARAKQVRPRARANTLARKSIQLRAAS